MKIKKIAAAALAAAMLAVSTAAGALPDPLSVTADAEETTTDGNRSYIVKEDGDGLTITEIVDLGAVYDIIIPSTLNGKAVAGIGEFAFDSYCSGIVSVTIPDCITRIERNPFAGCTELKKIIFIDTDSEKVLNVTQNYSLVDGILFDKGKSTLICYPAGINATSYVIPSEVRIIGEYAFAGCNLPTVTLPDNVTSINERAFMGCNCTSIRIGKGVTNIGKDALNCCFNLSSIIVDNNNTYFSSEGGALFNKDKTELIRYPGGNKSKNYTVPDSVKTISKDAFSYSENIVSVTIPDGITNIGHNAFDNCDNLKDVYFGGSKTQWEKFSCVNNNYNNSLLNATIHFAKEDEEESSTSSEPTSTPTTRPTSSSTTTPEETTSELPSPDIPTPDSGDFREENEVTGTVEPSPDAAGVPVDDRITSITINPAFNMKNKNGNDVELDLSKITVKASEIYDEEGLKRAEEALGETLKGNKKYNLLDLTLLYNGEDFSNGYEGLVKVIIPIPKGHRDKTFSCYRLVEVNGKTVKQLIPGEQTADSYIIYLEHFSVYALVADGDTPRGSNPTTGVAMATVPVAMIAAAVVVIAKKRK